jgi:Sensors of blue-light using FAD
MTYQIVYASVASTPMQSDELEDLLESAQFANAGEGITGALVYADGHFLQILEGDQGRLEPLMRRISKDLRHENVVVLLAGEVPAASFSDWSMAYVSASPEQVARWAGLGDAVRLPEVWETVRHNPDRTTQMARRILALLDGEAPS